MSEDRSSQDESRRASDRALSEAASGEERALARLKIATAERRRGQLDLAALAVEAALREGAALEAAGGELAALVAEDPGEPGARRALACFSALRAPADAKDPFPGFTVIARSAQLRVALFRATLRALPADRVHALARALVALAPGEAESFPAQRWTELLGRKVEDSEAADLTQAYGRLLGARRERVTARLDTPGPIHEVSSQKLSVDGDEFQLSFAGDDQLYSLRRMSGELLLRRNRLVGFQAMIDECPVLAGLDIAAPRLVGSAGGAFVAGVDADGLLHASFSVGRGELLASKKRVGKAVSVAAACECPAGLAVFLDAGARAVVFGRDGRFTREKRLGPGREIVSAAAHGGSEVVVLARSTKGCELIRLDADLRAVGDPVPVPYLRSPRDARVAWLTPDLILVIEPPDVAHAFGADDRRLAWTARIPEPLDDLEPALSEALELVAFGAIEGEWGQPHGDIGVARWTRDGLGRHGPTVRLEAEPGAALGAVKLAARGNLLAIAYREQGVLVQRLLLLVRVPPSVPAPAEWTFAAEE